MHILVDVASDRLKTEIIEYLERAGHTIERGSAIICRHFDLALVGTPEAAEKLRRARPFDAIIVVTKIGDVAARVQALEVGADDAFDASYPMAQVAVRVNVAGRRAAMMPRPSEVIEIDGCTIDLSASTAMREDTVALTTREVEIIRYLARHAGQVVSRGELLQNVWRVAAGNETRAVDVAMVGLRAKLERDAGNPAIILSVRGAGYRWG
ncbi:MAG: response regulator transcription factor [Myxococcota bacterium]|nr:response regulator transcription factor [Deltaproteobacteria bacterium]MDQ3337615.1 response regulator transcription factor [Myxococcota bacterium]